MADRLDVYSVLPSRAARRMSATGVGALLGEGESVLWADPMLSVYPPTWMTPASPVACSANADSRFGRSGLWDCVPGCPCSRRGLERHAPQQSQDPVSDGRDHCSVMVGMRSP